MINTVVFARLVNVKRAKLQVVFCSMASLLAACAQTPVAAPVAQLAPVAEVVTVAEAPVLPNIELTDEIVYQYLLTEFANQRGHTALAVEGSAALAQQTRDPRLARRAAQLALESGDMNRAVDAMRFWQETDPAERITPRLLSQILLRGGRLDEAGIEFEKVLKTEAPAKVFMQVYSLALSYPDKPAILKMMQAVAAPYPDVAEAHWLLAQLALAAADEPLALREVRRARALRAEWDAPVSLEAALLYKLDPQKSIELLQQYLSAKPGSGELRLQYARALLEQKQYRAAREAFRILAHDSPDNVDLPFAIALISLQLKDASVAEAELGQALSGKGPEVVAYFLGQLDEANENENAALKHYREVNTGEYQFAAQLRMAYLLNKKGELAQARQLLQTSKAVTDAQRVQLVVIEAQLLGEAQQYSEAYRVMERGRVKFPADADLLYEAAMLADKLGKYDASEKLLRELIRIKPAHAHAYNALGYSMLERNVHIAEAVMLVEKALQLTPDDYAIMDSVGWGYFRAGRLDESLAMLQRAFAGNPDPEIAAHLGEVLWVRGDKAGAARLWQESLKAHPANAQLEAVIKRYQP